MEKAKSVVILGLGRVGRAIGLDLSERYAVRAVDAYAAALQQGKAAGIEVVDADATDHNALVPIIEGADLVINALPGHLGFGVLKNVVESGKKVVDISFFPEDPFDLDDPARSRGLVAVVDCGVAPGLSNMILGSHCRLMEIESFACYVGGLPKVRTWPYQYKAPFSPVDVIEEYTRPARLVEHGQTVVRPALSDPEHLEFEGIGTLEAFNTDGLRTLLRTVRVPNMKEKTLRYPGHSEYIRVLRETGFFSTEEIDVNGTKIAPVEFTARLLFPHWQPAENEEEYTIMKIVIEGKEDGRAVTYTYDMADHFDKRTGLSSMARTTGFTCAAVASLVLDGRMPEVGILAPELIGMDRDSFDYVIDYLRSREIRLERSRAALN